MLQKIVHADSLYRVIDKRFGYGTAGFRTLGDTLDRVCFRAGLLAGIRAKTHGGLAGVMVTASHNPKQDNGLKIFERDGEMLEPSWEKLAEELVNAKDLASFLRTLRETGTVEGFKGKVEGDFAGAQQALVFIGMDTRESSERLCAAVAQGIELIGAEPLNFGLVTTPQLHWLTQRCNQLRASDPEAHKKIHARDFNEEWARNFH